MVSNLLNKSKRWLGTKQEGIISAALVVMLIGSFSRILGLVRDRLLAHFFGSSAVLGVYLASTRIPNLFFDLFVSSIIASSFIPIFSRAYEKNKQRSWRIFNAVAGFNLVLLLVFGLFFFVLAYPISRLIAPGFDPEQIKLMVSLSRIIYASQIFFILASFYTTSLQALQRFLLPALALSFYNLGIILGIVVLSPKIGIHGPAWGIMFGSFLYFLSQIPLVASLGYKFKLSFNWRLEETKKIICLSTPRVLSGLVFQVDATMDVFFASLISASSLVFFNFAQHVQFMPISLIGLTIAQASLPILSSYANKEDWDNFKAVFLNSFHQMLFLVVPISVMLVTLRIPVVRLLFGASQFDWQATSATGYVLAFFSLSIFAQSTVYLLTRAFYALCDTKTPVVIGTATVILNIGLSYLATRVLGWGVWSLALVTSINAFIDFIVLLILLSRRVGGFSREALIKPLVKITLASLIMGIFLYIPMKLLDVYIFDTRQVINLIVVTGIASLCGLSIYLALAKAFALREARTVWEVVKGLRHWRSLFKEGDIAQVSASTVSSNQDGVD